MRQRDIVREIRRLIQTKTLYVHVYDNIAAMVNINWDSEREVSVERVHCIPMATTQIKKKCVRPEEVTATIKSLSDRIQIICQVCDETAIAKGVDEGIFFDNLLARALES